MKSTVIIMSLLASALLAVPAGALDVNDPQSVAAETALLHDPYEGIWYLKGPQVSWTIDDDADRPGNILETPDGPVNADQKTGLILYDQVIHEYCLSEYKIEGERLTRQASWELTARIGIKCYPSIPNRAFSLVLFHAWSAGMPLSILSSLPSPGSQFRDNLPSVSQFFTLRLPMSLFQLWVKKRQAKIKFNSLPRDPYNGIVVTIPGGYLEGVWSVLQKQLQSHEKKGSGPG